MEKRILKLTLKKTWFDLILSGEKKEEYREIKDYFVSRLMQQDKIKVWHLDSVLGVYHFCNGYRGQRLLAIDSMVSEMECSFKEYDYIEFSNGYGKSVPKFTIEFKGCDTGTGRSEWGAIDKTNYFVIKLGNIISVENICEKCDNTKCETHECGRCNEYYCEDCNAEFNQFSQINYNCCYSCSITNYSEECKSK